MLKLYRGIIDILATQSREQDDALTKHIRSGCTDKSLAPNNFGVGGFWNLLLEIGFLLFTKLILLFGILGVMVLALIFFPLYAIKTSINNIFEHRALPFEDVDHK